MDSKKVNEAIRLLGDAFDVEVNLESKEAKRYLLEKAIEFCINGASDMSKNTVLNRSEIVVSINVDMAKRIIGIKNFKDWERNGSNLPKPKKVTDIEAYEWLKERASPDEKKLFLTSDDATKVKISHGRKMRRDMGEKPHAILEAMLLIDKQQRQKKQLELGIANPN